jgi:hypothetical protein
MKTSEFKIFASKFKTLFNIDLNKVYLDSIKEEKDIEAENIKDDPDFGLNNIKYHQILKLLKLII